MTKKFEWTKENFDKSVSSRCWWYSGYEDGWENPELVADDELRQIIQMEWELGSVPEWAEQVVRGVMNLACPCGHYSFPKPYLEILDAIGSQTPPAFIHSCYTADHQRKERMLDYLFCLDAWLAGVGPEAAASELIALKRKGPDWNAVCRGLWQVLGERTELKELLVERVLHRQRWWVKSLVWDDDARDLFCRDQYLAAFPSSGNDYGNPGFHDPYFTELESPRVKRIKARIAELRPDLQEIGEESWLCAPKAFRFLENDLCLIGKERFLETGEEVPGFLQCEDTYPEQDSASEWWKSFMNALGGWWRDEPETGDVADEVNQLLGEPTPIKRWLVRLFVRRLELHVKDGEVGRLVNPSPDTKRGKKYIT